MTAKRVVEQWLSIINCTLGRKSAVAVEDFFAASHGCRSQVLFLEGNTAKAAGAEKERAARGDLLPIAAVFGVRRFA